MSAFQRQSGIMKEVSQMVRDYVFQTALKKAPKERIEEMLKTVKCHKSVEVFRNGTEFSFYDLLDLVDAAGIDIGITVRMRDGEEVTFYPGHNFGKTGGKNGTPREKRVAKKPYEAYTPNHDYRANRGHVTGAANPAWNRNAAGRQVAGRTGGLYAQDDDNDGVDLLGHMDGYGQRIGPKTPEPLGTGPALPKKVATYKAGKMTPEGPVKPDPDLPRTPAKVEKTSG